MRSPGSGSMSTCPSHPTRPGPASPPHWRRAAPWSATPTPRRSRCWPIPRATRSACAPGRAASPTEPGTVLGGCRTAASVDRGPGVVVGEACLADRVDQRVSFITLAVPDLDAVRAFYVAGLGWRPALDVPGEVLMLKVGDLLLLSLWVEPQFEAEVGVIRRGGGLAPIT